MASAHVDGQQPSHERLLQPGVHFGERDGLCEIRLCLLRRHRSGRAYLFPLRRLQVLQRGCLWRLDRLCAKDRGGWRGRQYQRHERRLPRGGPRRIRQFLLGLRRPGRRVGRHDRPRARFDRRAGPRAGSERLCLPWRQRHPGPVHRLRGPAHANQYRAGPAQRDEPTERHSPAGRHFAPDGYPDGSLRLCPARHAHVRLLLRHRRCE